MIVDRPYRIEIYRMTVYREVGAMTKDIESIIREIAQAVLNQQRLKLLSEILYLCLALGVGLWALLTLRQTFWHYFGL